MKLSIIVPVYNMVADGKLSFCMDSLVNQTIDDYEIIAVDDCSSDDSVKLLKQYKERFPDKVKVIESSENGRQGTAKNKGIRAATGEWIGFIDSDDWIAPDMYEKLIKRAEETGADVVGCDYSLVNTHTFGIGEVVPNSRDVQVGVLDMGKRKSLVLDGGSLCVKIYKRERIVSDGLFFPEKIFYEDNAIGNSYLVGASHFEYVKEPLYYYYQHDTSTIHTVTQSRCKDRMTAAKFMIDDAKKRGYYEELKEELDYKFIMLFFLNTMFSYVREGKHVKLSFVKEIAKGLIDTVPDYNNNKYYSKRISAEEKKYTDMSVKSPLKFMITYKLHWAYRHLKGIGR